MAYRAWLTRITVVFPRPRPRLHQARLNLSTRTIRKLYRRAKWEKHLAGMTAKWTCTGTLHNTKVVPAQWNAYHFGGRGFQARRMKQFNVPYHFVCNDIRMTIVCLGISLYNTALSSAKKNAQATENPARATVSF